MKCSVNGCRLCPTVRAHASVPSSVAWFDVTCDSDSAHCVEMNYVCAQLGDGSNMDRSTPPSSDVLTGVAAITAGRFYTCALTTAGGVRCWGMNTHGWVRHHLHTCAVSVSVWSTHTRNRAQCMCAAVVNDDARLPWLIACVLVCALLVSQLSVCLNYEV
jgi:hypothetical protein